MSELRAPWTQTLQAGASRLFGFLQVDIAKHSSLPGADFLIHQTRENVHKHVCSILAVHHAQELAWAGDGGAYLFLIDNGSEYNEMVTGAIRIMDAIPLFNRFPSLNRLAVPLRLRISCHTGPAIWDTHLHNLFGKSLNYFLKSERELGIEDQVAITEEVFEQISDTTIKNLFSPLREHGYIYNGQQYTRRIYVCGSPSSNIRESLSPQLASYPSPSELANLLRQSRTVEALLAGGDRFYAKLSEALDILNQQQHDSSQLIIRILLRKSNESAGLNARKYKRITSDFDVKVEVRWYDSDLMLRGYCFDKKQVFLSYFLRENDRLTGGRNQVASVLAGRSQIDDFLVTLFLRTFSAFFERSDSLGHELATLPFVGEI